MDIKHFGPLDLMSYSLQDRHKHFRGTCSLHLQVNWTCQKTTTI